MMLLSDAVEAFRSEGVPVALVRFENDSDNRPSPPYVEARLNRTRYEYADDKVLHSLCNYDFTLYCKRRDLSLEGRIEQKLGEAEINLRDKTDGNREDLGLVTVTFEMKLYER